MTLDEILTQYTIANRALHKLWTDRVGTPGYDKKAWQALSNALDRITRHAATAEGLPRGDALVKTDAIEHRPMIRTRDGLMVSTYCSCGFEPGGDSDTAMASHLAIFKGGS